MSAEPHSADPAADERPFVSVIVPVYNGEGVIPDCIESLLAQDYPSGRYEVIVVDNGSTDRTADVIGRYPVRYVLEDEVLTSYAARNAGTRVARGEALAFCDADQVADPGWLTAVTSRWHDARYAAFTGPHPVFPAEDTVIARALSTHEFGAELDAVTEDVPAATTGNLVVRAEAFRAVGGFQAQIPTGEDIAFSLRLQRETGLRILRIAEAVQWHRSRKSLADYMKRGFRSGWQADLCRRGVLEKDYRRLPSAFLTAAVMMLRAFPASARNAARRPGGHRMSGLLRPFAVAMRRWAGIVGRLSGMLLGDRGLPRGW